MLHLQLSAAAQSRSLHGSSLQPTAAVLRLQRLTGKQLVPQQAVRAAAAADGSDVAAEAQLDEQRLLSLLRLSDGPVKRQSAAQRNLERKERLSGNRKATREQRWRDKLWLLHQFVEAHGRMPRMEENRSLYKWCNDQRTAYNGPGPTRKSCPRYITDDRIWLLQQVGGDEGCCCQ